MHWHQDDTNNRSTQIDRFLGLYYPRTITPNMGPTIVVPGTQFRNARPTAWRPIPTFGVNCC